ncbi:MAG: hypothetical protein RLZ98_938 [Pseudomonadota bacterium]|jgi:trk system potassium uptake protein TrkH
MHIRRVMFTVGLVLCGLATAMVIPALTDAVDGSTDWLAFFAGFVTTAFVGGLMIFTCFEHGPSAPVGIREGFVLTALSWVAVAAFSALPFLGLGLGYADAFFEAMSGLTTTGATVLVGLDRLPRGILLWRALLQGLGGLGIVVTAILMLPFLKIGGMQLFQTESSDRSEKILPRAAQLFSATAIIYVVLIVACTVIYVVLGMTVFDAICHSLSTLSTGGFSTHDASFAFFKSASLEWAAIVFMLLGALPFVVLIKAAFGQPASLYHDTQVRGFLAFIATVSIIMALWLVLVREVGLADALRQSTFSVVSIVTTTGFTADDYTLWGSFSVAAFFYLTFVGGCAGSTAGGMKIYRFQVAGQLTRRYLQQLIRPNQVVPLSYNGRRLKDDVPFSIIAFMAVYMLTIGAFTVMLAAVGLDLITAISSAATAVSNVGPGLGDTVGPSGNFARLPESAKWILSLAMLLGRLELFTLLVLFQPEFWRH